MTEISTRLVVPVGIDSGSFICWKRRIVRVTAMRATE